MSIDASSSTSPAVNETEQYTLQKSSCSPSAAGGGPRGGTAGDRQPAHRWTTTVWSFPPPLASSSASNIPVTTPAQDTTTSVAAAPSACAARSLRPPLPQTTVLPPSGVLAATNAVVAAASVAAAPSACAARGLRPPLPQTTVLPPSGVPAATNAVVAAASVAAAPSACAARGLLPPLPQTTVLPPSGVPAATNAVVAAASVAAAPSACAARGLLPLAPHAPTVLPPSGVLAATNAEVAAASVAATPSACAARGLLPPLSPPTPATMSGVRAPAASSAEDITVAISSLAAAPTSGLPVPTASTTHVSFEGAALTRPVVASAVALPGPAAAARAATADDAVDGDLEAIVSEALDPDGCGWVVLPLNVPDDVLEAVCDGAYGPAAEAAQPIINSQLHARMLELGDAADRGRRQVPVASQGGGFEGAVHRVFGAVASRVGSDLHAAYDGVTPHIVITMPRAPAQLPHTDAGLHIQEESTATLLSVYVSVEEGTGVEVFSSVYGGAGQDGE